MEGMNLKRPKSLKEINKRREKIEKSVKEESELY